MTNTQVSLINSINRNTFIISDNHFGHRNVISFEPCRITQTKLDNLSTQEDMMISRHNSTVEPDDTVLILGDFAFNRIKHYMDQLNGKKILILGNHDKRAEAHIQHQSYAVIDGVYQSTDNYLSKFVGIGDENTSGLIKEIDNQLIYFCHYALFDQNDYDMRQSYIQKQMLIHQRAYIYNDCDINMHGHLHSNDSLFPNSINCSAEKLNFYPKKIGELLDEFKSKK